MDELYSRVSEITKQALYSFIKEEEISTLNYHFRNYFDHCIDLNQIQVIPHHFSNHKIEGLTIIDRLGISFSYEKDNPVTKRNFTLCHELGHFILKHNGTCFTESVYNKGDILEREANIFSAVVLMPDIVLLSKIYYGCSSFKTVQDSLEVSKQALYFRLLDLLREYFPDREDNIKHAIEAYIENENVPIHFLFHDIKDLLIKEFNQYSLSLEKQFKNRISKEGFASSKEFPELLKQESWPELKRSIDNLKIWLVYNKGKSVAYAWDSKKISDESAKKKAELKLLLE
ncbi:ImmA/IrrE family metallo-endopeptidase [Streptococcus timonensis]|uniref:ImmA/IrrE family metallo-endopeptidase n=1 Tax=Streptococcus timonensis TaxID=1852387 RepID=UPI00094E23EE|nr:ImmA/IrrE family metallo-endopeptidase [Streptococcus timonensis]